MAKNIEEQLLKEIENLQKKVEKAQSLDAIKNYEKKIQEKQKELKEIRDARGRVEKLITTKKGKK